MPTIQKPHHASKFHFVILAVVIAAIMIFISLPASEETMNKEYPKPLVAIEEPVEPTEVETEPTQLEPVSTDININTYWGKYDQPDITIEKGTKVTWTHADDSKMFLIACYRGPNRFLKSENFFPGESFSFTFTEDGEYLCQEAIYGARGFITVGDPDKVVQKFESIDDILLNRDAITGGVVQIDNFNYQPPSGRVTFSADPFRRMLFTPTGLSAFIMLAIVALIVGTIEHSIHLD
jgi:plastocyanin|tara:strand:- start:159 stop:866 length:708 start_codon:yes stop_codon:yes gene_type:complete